MWTSRNEIPRCFGADADCFNVASFEEEFESGAFFNSTGYNNQDRVQGLYFSGNSVVSNNSTPSAAGVFPPSIQNKKSGIIIEMQSPGQKSPEPKITGAAIEKSLTGNLIRAKVA